MNAADIAAALGHARREGQTWRCRCPLHGGRSLSLRDGDDGRILVTCWGGCDRLDVLAELRREGLLDGDPGDYRSIPGASRSRDDEERRIARALNIWRGTTDGEDSIASRYLAGRDIVLNAWPPSLRFHSRCPRPKEHGMHVPPFPAMVGLVEHIRRGTIGVHCTFLKPDGSGKADLEKAKVIYGPVGGGAVRFGMPLPGQLLAVAEGIETSLSIAVSCSMPVWAALSAMGIRKLELPPEATDVVICADRDASGTGESAAQHAAARWLAEDRRVRIAVPPQLDSDFNDFLIGSVVTSPEEADRVG